MGKKKKKATTPSKLLPLSAVGSTPTTPPLVDCLTLRATHKGSSRDKPGDWTVVVTTADAQQLNVVADEPVFLIAQHNNNNNNNNTNGNVDTFRAVVARVGIAKSTAAPTSTSSPAAKNRQQPLQTGHAQVTSSSLWKMLVPTAQSDDDDDDESQQVTSPTPSKQQSTTPPAVATPSTPSTPFSFRSATTPSPARGTTPRTATTTSTTTSSSSSSSTTNRLVVIPMDSALGQRVAQRLVRTAAVVTVRPPIMGQSLLLPSANPAAVALLVRAYWTHAYIQQGQTLTLSAAGQYVTVNVVAITTTMQEQQTQQEQANEQEQQGINDGNIHELLDKLTLDEKEDDLLSDLLLPQEATNKNATVCLCRMTPQTKVVVLPPLSNDENEGSPQDESKQLQQTLTPSSHSNAPQQFVVGLDREIDAACQVLQAPLLRSNVFAKRGALRPPKGVLLHGPSGVGKSCLLRQIAAHMQQRRDCDVRIVSCTALQTSLTTVGQAERVLSRYFALRDNRKKAVLLVMDDIHLICPRRGATHNPPGVDQLAATLLSLMDGVDSTTSSTTTDHATPPLMILATTFNPSLLDPALRRPGRLDTEIEVPIPDEPAARAAILKFHLTRHINTSGGSSSSISPDEWLGLGKLAKGFNGSDCMLAIKEATRIAQLRHLESSYTTGQTSENIEATDPNLQDLMRGIRQTKPSSIKAVTVEIPHVQWSDIGGMQDVKRELREAIEQPLHQGDLYTKLRLPSPRGILLYGPPGCSKTLTARALATEGQMNFLAVKGPELLSKWLGESERALASLFRRARMASPAIIFFDEMDAIAARRGSGDSASSSRMLSQLLTELDGVSSSSSSGTFGKTSGKAPRVVVVGATNRPDLLDPALTRPGRMDRMIYVGPPDAASRQRIFEIGLRGRPCAATVNDDMMKVLARKSDGFSGAEIIAICRNAALMALEEDKSQMDAAPVITMQHLEASMASMNRQISPDMLSFYDEFRHRRK